MPLGRVANDRLRYMLIGYARVSKTDGSQSLDLQRDALRTEGIDAVNQLRLRRPRRPAGTRQLRTRPAERRRARRLEARPPRPHPRPSGQHRAEPVRPRGGAAGRLVFGIFAALAEFERKLIRERTVAGLTAARGRQGGRTFALSKAQVRLAQAAMAHRDTSVSALCKELGIKPVTLYRDVGPQGQLREHGQKILGS